MSSSNVSPSIASESKIDETAQGSSMCTNENVDFVLADTFSISDPTPIDPSRDMRIRNDSRDLDSFFSRPIRIYKNTWDVNTAFYATTLPSPDDSVILDPWALYFQNKRVENRINNFKLLRCKLCIRVMINGNSFYYGRLLVGYHPKYLNDALFYTSAPSTSDFVCLSQLPSFYLSPTGSHSAEMQLPMFHESDVFDIPTRSWTGMGRLILKSVGALKCSNTTSTPVTISIFAWATDVDFGGLTSLNMSQIDPQSDEHSVKPVSRVASTIAAMAGKLSDVPVIGKYARATQIGASAASHIASLFGFSKPVQLDTSVIVRHAKNNISQYNTEDDAHKLSLDAKQEVTIDPTITGAMSCDEMAISYLASRPSYYHSFDWDTSYQPDRQLFAILVDPCISRWLTGEPGTGFLVPPMAAATYPFKYWRGSLKYKFDIVCSSFHKGRLRICYEPSGVTPSSPEFNINTNMIVDISEQTSFEFCVPWTQATAFKQHVPFAVSETLVCSTTDSNLNFPYHSFIGNGSLFIYVLNQLTCVTATQGSTVSIIVTVSACDDFEVAAPTSWDLCNMRHFAPHNPTMVDPGIFEPQSCENTDVVSNTIMPTNIKDPADLIYFGESVRSIRPLLKRYSMVYTPFLNWGTSFPFDTLMLRIPMMPFDGGSRFGPFNANVFVAEVPDVPDHYYARAYMNYISYFSKLYAGWRGSVRYMVDNTAIKHQVSAHITRCYNCPISSVYSVNSFTNMANPNAFANYFAERVQFSSGMTADVLSTSTIDPIVSIEVPYQSNKRFFGARRCQMPLQNSEPQSVQILYTSSEPASQSPVKTTFTPTDVSAIWVSTGEDFSLSYFVGVPILYYEARPY